MWIIIYLTITTVKYSNNILSVCNMKFDTSDLIYRGDERLVRDSLISTF